jgi:hypothetical protein
MFAPEPEDTLYGPPPNIPQHAGALVGILLENGLRILGGSADPDYGPNAPSWKSHVVDPFGIDKQPDPLSASDLGANIGSTIRSYLGQNVPGLSQQQQALLDQILNVAGLGNIPGFSTPGGDTKQSVIDQMVTQLLGGMSGHSSKPGDPLGGRLPGGSRQHDVTIPDGAVSEMLKAMQMVTKFQQANVATARSHDPYRNDPLHGAPVHPEWWSDAPTLPSSWTSAPVKDAIKDGANSLLTVQICQTAGAVSLGLAGAATGDPAMAVFGGAMGAVAGAAFGWARVYAGKPIPFFKFPDPDGGDGGPRAIAQTPTAETAFIPDPDGGRSGGPRGFAVMPNPESSGGGGPRGLSFPDPDSVGGGAGGPH